MTVAPVRPQWQTWYLRGLYAAGGALIAAPVLVGVWSSVTSDSDADASSSTSGAVDASAAGGGPAAQGVSGTATCTDVAGDAAVQDMSSVSLQSNGDQLVLTVDSVTDRPTAGTAGWFLNVATADGSRSRQLGVKTNDGGPVGYFVFDNSTVQQTNLLGEPILSARRLIASFPASTVSDLGPSWQWQVVSTAEGDDSDACPGTVVQGRASFDRLPFPN